MASPRPLLTDLQELVASSAPLLVNSHLLLALGTTAKATPSNLLGARSQWHIRLSSGTNPGAGKYLNSMIDIDRADDNCRSSPRNKGLLDGHAGPVYARKRAPKFQTLRPRRLFAQMCELVAEPGHVNGNAVNFCLAA
jgi:hypothetical protein